MYENKHISSKWKYKKIETDHIISVQVQTNKIGRMYKQMLHKEEIDRLQQNNIYCQFGDIRQK